MFLSQIASVCHYLHSRHIVHGNLRAVYVYVESPDKVTFRLYIDWIGHILTNVLSFPRRNMTSMQEITGRSPRKRATFSPIYPTFVENNLVPQKSPPSFPKRTT